MAVEMVLKSWLRQKYTDNNNLKTTFGSGNTLTVPTATNTLTLSTDINTLLTSLRAMQSNTYLRYSPLWSSVDTTNVAIGDLIEDQQKLDVNNLVTDLLAMNARYSKTPTEFTDRSSNASQFSNNTSNVSTFTQNSTNASQFSNNTSNVTTFTQNSTNATSFVFFDANLQFTFNSGNTTGNNQFSANATAFGFNSAQGTAFSRNDSNKTGNTFNSANVGSFTNRTNFSQTCSNFTRNSRTLARFDSNRSDFSRDAKFTQVASFTQNSTNAIFTRQSNSTSFGQNSSNGVAFNRSSTFFSNNQDKTATVNRFFRCWQASEFGQNSTNATAFSRDTRASAFSFNGSNATAFSKDSRASAFTRDTRFSQRFNYSFLVKSDGTTTTHSNVGA